MIAVGEATVLTQIQRQEEKQGLPGNYAACPEGLPEARTLQLGAFGDTRADAHRPWPPGVCGKRFR